MVRLNRDILGHSGFSPAGWKIHRPNETDLPARTETITFEVDAETAARLEVHVAMLRRLAPGGAWDSNRAALNLMLSALERLGPPAA